MNTRRWAVAGGVALSMALAIAACGNSTGSTPGAGDSSSSASSAAADPRQQLADALKPLSDMPFHVVVSGGAVTGQGDADPVRKDSRMTLKVLQSNGSTAMAVSAVTVADQMWLRLDQADVRIPGVAEGLSTKWWHIDTSRLGPNSQAGIASGTGPVDTTRLLGSAENVQKVDDTHYTGTLDLTKGHSMAVNEKTLSALADKARAVPFQATVDDQQRLTEFKITIPAVGDQPPQVIDTTYSHFGDAVNISAPPAGDVAEAPQQLYQMFQS